MIAIIPARGGSKELPRKNIKSLGGKPLIYWTIEAAKKSKKIERIILSTDDHEIADICKKTEIEIPFMRPVELAQDKSLAIDTYLYTMERLINEYEYKKDEFIVLQPTSPFRNSSDIESAIEIFYENNADSVISCRKLDHPISWLYSINKSGLMKKKMENDLNNRQNADIPFIPNGGIYIFRYSLLKTLKKYCTENTYAHVMPKERSVDIDTEDDFKFAEYLYNKYKK